MPVIYIRAAIARRPTLFYATIERVVEVAMLVHGHVRLEAEVAVVVYERSGIENGQVQALVGGPVDDAAEFRFNLDSVHKCTNVCELKELRAKLVVCTAVITGLPRYSANANAERESRPRT